MKSKILSTIAAAGLVTVAFVAPAAASHENAVYNGSLQELNDSGARGTATITVSADGETMTVDLAASGFNLDGPHAMHIHGIVDGDTVSASSCPSIAEDANNDGVLTVAEGALKYGGVQVSLTTTGDTTPDSALAVERFPAGTSINYSRAEIPIPAELKPNLAKLHVVVHGIDENGNGTLDLDQTERSSLTDDLPREATAPALCGTLTVAATGQVQTGAGGTAAVTDAGNATTLVLGSASVAAMAAVALGYSARRRVTVS